eukprot:215629_1
MGNASRKEKKKQEARQQTISEEKQTKEKHKIIARNNDSSNDTPIKRLTTALEHYSDLDIIHNNKHRDLFMDFIENKYPQLLDDFIILTKETNEKLYQIQQTLIKNNKFTKCDINNCDFTSRHVNERGIHNKSALDPTLNFYKHTMDSLHFYIF